MAKLSMQELEKIYVEAGEVIRYAHLNGIDSTRYRAIGCIKSGLILILSDNNKLKSTIDNRNLNLRKINKYLVEIKNNCMTMISAALSLEDQASHIAELIMDLNMKLFKLAQLINSPINKSRTEIYDKWLVINEAVIALLGEKEGIDSMFSIENNKIMAG